MNGDDDQESTGQAKSEGPQDDLDHWDGFGRRYGRAVIRPLAARTAVLALRSQLKLRAGGCESQDNAVPSPRLTQAVLGSDRDCHAGLEPGQSGVRHGN